MILSTRDVAESSVLPSHSTGLLPRLKIPKNVKRPRINYVDMRDDQLFTVYALVNWCKDRRGLWGEGFSHYEAYCQYLRLPPARRPPSVYKTFADPDEEFTKTVAHTMFKHHLVDFFGDKAHEIVEGMYPGAVLELPSRPETRR